MSLPGEFRRAPSAVLTGWPRLADTSTVVVTATCEDWTTYGKIQQELNTDSEMIQLMLEGGKMATWQTFTSQTIDFDLLP